MFNKLFQRNPPKDEKTPGVAMSNELNPRMDVHYGVPFSASILAFDPIQRLLAIGTKDGRIKVIGGNSIEGLFTSPKPLQFKYLQFLQNQGFLVSVSIENEIQVWDMEHRKMASLLKMDLNITAFSVVDGTSFMYIGDEYAMVSVLKYDAETGTLVQLPYHVPGSFIADATGVELPYRLPVVGVLPQPCSQGNRILIAYANGLLTLWDASENKAAWVGGHQVLTLKDIGVVHISKDIRNETSDDTSTHEQVEKEISSLCWAAIDGSVVAVGYADGDILFWNLSAASIAKDQLAKSSSGDVVKLQLSPGDKRSPVAILHQSANKSHKYRGCQLLVYGGDEIGIERVPTVLSLDWTSGIETLKCTARVDLTLSGALVDIIFLPSADMMASDTSLLILKKPGKLHFYDDACLSALVSDQERKTAASTLEYHSVMVTVEPCLTVGKLCLIVSDAKLQGVVTPESIKWPMTGGVPVQLRNAGDYKISRLYVAGYGDGSVRIWDATYPSLYPMYVLGSEVNGVDISGTTLSVSAVDFCSISLRVAIGNESGLIRLYELIGSSGADSLHFVTETDNEVKTAKQGAGPWCRAVFSLLDSPITTLLFASSGDKLAAGFECGKVAVLDISSSSLLFITECVSGSSSPVISMSVKSFPDANCSPSSPKDSESKGSNDSGRLAVFVFTREADLFIINIVTGNIITSNSVLPKESVAVSLHIIEENDSPPEVSGEEHSPKSSQNSEAKNDLERTNSSVGNKKPELDSSTGTPNSGQRLMSSLVLFSYEDELHLYSMKSVIQEDSKSIKEVKLGTPCRWITTFSMDGNKSLLAVLYQTGVIEMRSFPDLEVVGECSYMSILRWTFKTNMEKAMSYSDRGQIVLVNRNEFAILSLLTEENDFSIPEALPCLHDKVLAASDDPTHSSSPQQGGAPGFLGGLFKGLIGVKEEPIETGYEIFKKNIKQMESIFSKEPALEPEPTVTATDTESASVTDTATAPKEEQKTINLNIDDIHIGGWIRGSAAKSKNEEKDKETEKKQLLEGGSSTADTKPQTRTTADIRAKYGRKDDVAAVAAAAKEKLAERQEKLDLLVDHSEELEEGAQDFASMAKEIAKKMEHKKWWQL